MTPKEKLEQSEEFLRQLQHTIPEDERVMVGYADEATVQTDAATGKKMNAGWWPVPWKDGKYVRQQGNCYVCISSSIQTPNPKTGKMRYWRGEVSFGHGLALMVDDIGNGQGSKGGLTLDYFDRVLPPTAVVETSPGNYQLWYFLEEPCDSLIFFKALLNCFVASVLKKGGDNTIKDVSRYGRMPLGINNKKHGPNMELKYKTDNGKPFNVRLVSADYTRRFSPEKIARAFGFSIVVPQKVRVDISEEEYKFDAVWLRMAEYICSRMKMGEGSNGDVSMNMSGKYRIRCPWGDEHTNGDPYGAYFRGPIPGAEHEFVFGCGHDTCRKLHKRTWSVFVDELVIPYIAERLDQVNRKACGLA